MAAFDHPCRWSVPERPVPFAAARASPLRCTFGDSPLSSNGSSTCVDIWRLVPSRLTVVLLSHPFGPSPGHRLLTSPGCPALASCCPATMASADCSPRSVPLRTASYALRVPRLAVSFHASSPRSVTLAQWRFTSLAVVSLREDLHLQDRTHAGRTTTGKPPKGRRLPNEKA